MESTAQKKIVRLVQSPNALAALDELREQLVNGEVVDFVIASRTRVPKDEQRGAGKYQVRKFWFGLDSCVGVMGLLEYMKMEIYEYIVGRSDE